MPNALFFVIFLLLGLGGIACGGGGAGAHGEDQDRVTGQDVRAEPLSGPLAVSRQNPRYFADPQGNVVYLTGFHTWANVQDFEKNGTFFSFDYSAHIADLKRYNHNFTRIWAWESSRTDEHTSIAPLAYTRTGPGRALDGGLKFDLEQFNQAYFDRLRSRVAQAQDQGIYVMVMLFQGFSLSKDGANAWSGHPYNRANNINAIDGDADGDGEGKEVHTLRVSVVTQLQQAYVSKVVDTLNDFDNVIWEISNESHNGATRWQYHFIDYLHTYEAGKPKQHPVVMSVQLPKNNELLFLSSAEAIAPGEGGYEHNPPPADGRKVVIADTDHQWGLGGSQEWVWTSFLRGINPIFMDPHDGSFLGNPDIPAWEVVRRNMSSTRMYASRIQLAAMIPRVDLASSGYCLANPGKEYLVYVPCEGIIGGRGCRIVRWWSQLSQGTQLQKTARFLGWHETVRVDLSAASKVFQVEWFNPTTGKTLPAGTVSGGSRHTFTAPFSGDAVLYLAVDDTMGA